MASDRRKRRLLGVAMSLAIVACGGDRGETERMAEGPSMPVRTAEVVESTAPATMEVAGVVEPIRRATPAGRLMGTVTAALFQEGDRVAAGEQLVRIDIQDLAARRGQILAQAREAARALDDAETNLARMRALMAERAIARVQLEQAETAVVRARAAVDTANAALRELEANAAYGTIEAPFSGVIVRKMVEVGNIAAPGQPLFVLEDLSRVRIVATVGEDLARQLRRGDRVRVEIGVGATQTTGVVEAVVPSGDLAAPGLRINVLVDNPTLALRSGMTATVQVPAAGAVPAALYVPADAVIRRGQMTGVFVASGGVARLRWVSLGEAEGSLIRVLSGLRDGELVVAGPEREQLHDGQRLTVGGRVVR